MVTAPATLLVPVKALAVAKSRVALPRSGRERLVLDLMARTLDAARRARLVGCTVVVAGDERTGAAAREHGARVVVERGSPDLNSAVDQGRRWARHSAPVAVLCVLVGDLAEPDGCDIDALIAEHLDRRSPLFVCDHEGTGTTSVVLPTADHRATWFGTASARAHARAGFQPADGPLVSLRRDVDLLDHVPVELLAT